MPVIHHDLTIRTEQRGPRDITALVEEKLARSGLASGIATVFCAHTSCSLILMENVSRDAMRDLERFFEKLVPPSPAYEHNDEGPDDMPSHVKMVLTRSSETVPFRHGRLLLGTWQGIFLWEHRTAPHTRTIRLTFIGE